MRRALLKLSGEALCQEGQKGFDEAAALEVVRQIKTVTEEGLQLGIVIGGGNFWRGRDAQGMQREKADQLGMLATVMNCLYLAQQCNRQGLATKVYTPFVCGTFTSPYEIDDVEESFAQGKVVFFAGGTGNPYFSTDTATVLRALEIGADAVLVAKAIDGIYDSDPKKNPHAVKYDEVSIEKVIEDHLEAMDLSSSIMCMDNRLPMLVFAVAEPDSIVHAVRGDAFHGTRVTV